MDYKHRLTPPTSPMRLKAATAVWQIAPKIGRESNDADGPKLTLSGGFEC
ncbi:hypothetical protein GCM10007385_32660 [Tateyamaria omphalii]|nr:hypothetical protein GCM10007385_32660 [Tateyamaria omphalii]